MTTTLIVNPFLGIQICAMLQTVVLGFLVVVPRDYRPPRRGGTIVFELLRSLGIGSLAVFGLFFIDMAVGWFFSGWSLADWRYQLPSVLILAFLGVQYVIVTLFYKGNLVDTFYFITIALTIMLFFHWWIPLDVVFMGRNIEAYLPIILAALIVIYVPLSIARYIFMKRIASTRFSKLIAPWWTISDKMHAIFNRKVNFILWILAVLQSMLTLLGYSLITVFM